MCLTTRISGIVSASAKATNRAMYTDDLGSLRRQVSVFYVDFKSEPGSRADSKESKSTDSLLLLHGFPSCSADFHWKFLEKLLKRFSRVISFDYPGPGDMLYSFQRISSLAFILAVPVDADSMFCVQAMVSATSPGVWSHPRTPFTHMQMWRNDF